MEDMRIFKYNFAEKTRIKKIFFDTKLKAVLHSK